MNTVNKNLAYLIFGYPNTEESYTYRFNLKSRKLFRENNQYFMGDFDVDSNTYWDELEWQESRELQIVICKLLKHNIERSDLKFRGTEYEVYKKSSIILKIVLDNIKEEFKINNEEI